MEKHGQILVMESHKKWAKKSWKMGKKVMEIEDILKKSRKSHGISLLLIMNQALEVPKIPYL